MMHCYNINYLMVHKVAKMISNWTSSSTEMLLTHYHINNLTERNSIFYLSFLCYSTIFILINFECTTCNESFLHWCIAN